MGTIYNLIEIILGIITLIGVVVAVISYINKPTTSLDKQLALDKESSESTAKALALQVQWEKDSNSKKFEDIGKRLDDAFALAQNHTHSVDVKVDMLTNSVNAMNLSLTNEITKLTTIINERIPPK